MPTLKTLPSNRKALRNSSSESPKTSELKRVKAKIEQATGENVKAAPTDWLRLMKDGVIVRLHIRRWRAKTQVTFQDLGLPQPKDQKEREVYNDLMTLGAKRLQPAHLIRKLDSIDAGARAWLDHHAYKTYWGDFVPLGTYEEFKQGNADFSNKYFAVRDEIEANWDNNVAEVIAAYAVAAANAYKRLSRLNPKSLMIADTQTRISEAAFVEAFVARIQNSIPTKEQVYESFGYETELSFIPLPSMLAEDQAIAERIETKRAQERNRAEVEARAISDRERMLRDMNNDVVNSARRKKQELVEGFVKDLRTQSLGMIYDGFTNVLESLQKNDKLVGKSAEQVRNTIDTWRAMNLVGDQSIESQITRIDALMTQPTKDRSPKEIQLLLKEIATAARANLIALGSVPRSARALGIPDDVEPLQLRRAKRTMQLSLAEV
ncbi:MAG: hypothetical protein HZB51_34320 [Chloroflexi bacterium]|nr:hypothetical protein [Chloroflexota bacterium]